MSTLLVLIAPESNFFNCDLW